MLLRRCSPFLCREKIVGNRDSRSSRRVAAVLKVERGGNRSGGEQNVVMLRRFFSLQYGNSRSVLTGNERSYNAEEVCPVPFVTGFRVGDRGFQAESEISFAILGTRDLAGLSQPAGSIAFRGKSVVRRRNAFGLDPGRHEGGPE